MRKLIENNSSKLEHLRLDLKYFDRRLPTKLPNNLKSFSLQTSNEEHSILLVQRIARDCKNLKNFHLKIDTLLPNDMILAIGNIQSLVYLSLNVYATENEITLKNVICHELPNLKALNIGGYCSEEMISNICRDCPDLVHLNVFTRITFQISDSINSLTLRNHWNMDFDQFLPAMLFNQQNKSIQHLDIHWFCFSSSSNFMEKLLGQFPNLKSLHCKNPATYAEFISLFSLIEKHLANRRKIAIYLHLGNPPVNLDIISSKLKYILPDDLPLINKAGWSPKMHEIKGKCENLVLKKLIKEAIDGGNNPSFLDDWWME